MNTKATYNFNEVTSITGVKPYVLRFWESEFVQINPSKTEDGVKLYNVSDIENIQIIKRLLFDEKLSIPQAKGRLSEMEVAALNTTLDVDVVIENNIPHNPELESHLHHLLNKIDNCISQHNWN